MSNLRLKRRAAFFCLPALGNVAHEHEVFRLTLKLHWYCGGLDRNA
jgi:hypothetical protein